MGAGARVHLKFDPNVCLRGAKQGIGGVGFFPGAIVALRGKNGGGGWFTVTEVLPVSNKVLNYIFTLTLDTATVATCSQYECSRGIFILCFDCLRAVHGGRRSEI